jgi:hypothetical protein
MFDLYVYLLLLCIMSLYTRYDCSSIFLTLKAVIVFTVVPCFKKNVFFLIYYSLLKEEVGNTTEVLGKTITCIN